MSVLQRFQRLRKGHTSPHGDTPWVLCSRGHPGSKWNRAHWILHTYLVSNRFLLSTSRPNLLAQRYPATSLSAPVGAVSVLPAAASPAVGAACIQGRNAAIKRDGSSE